jgi:hypothetical protein
MLAAKPTTEAGRRHRHRGLEVAACRSISVDYLFTCRDSFDRDLTVTQVNNCEHLK